MKGAAERILCSFTFNYIHEIISGALIYHDRDVNNGKQQEYKNTGV